MAGLLHMAMKGSEMRGTLQQPTLSRSAAAPVMSLRVAAPAGWSRSMSASWRATLAGPGRHTSA